MVTAPVSTDLEDVPLVRSKRRKSVRKPQLGILSLAGVLEQFGYRPCVFDLDEAYSAYWANGQMWDAQEFPAWVAPKILSTGSTLFGFSSICSSYPLTMRIAQQLKRENPYCTTLLGGPQASVVDLTTLAAFPFVDFVLRGEAEQTLLLFLSEWLGERRFSKVPGLTWRSPFGPQRNADAPPIENLDDLPRPAYHLSADVESVAYGMLELGRGCPFACTFCSTNDFFRRKFRVKSPQRMLEDMRWLSTTYGFADFNLVHDMFTVDRRRVVAFCETLIEAKEDFRWSCSARTDCVDEHLLRLMARAGCNSIFFGVESGSVKIQRQIDKDLDPVQSRRMVEITDRLGMRSTVSVIVGFPEETESDLSDTLDVFMHAMRQPNAGPQPNVLAPLAGTPIYRQFREQLVLEDISSRLAGRGSRLTDGDRELVRTYPDIFPNFYLLPAGSRDRRFLHEMVEFLGMCRDRLRWLWVAVYRRRPDLLNLFQAWREHRMAIHAEISDGGLREYYRLDAAKADVVRFLRARMAEWADPAVEALLKCEEALMQARENAPPRPQGRKVEGRVRLGDVPVRAVGCDVIELDWDIQAVIEDLKQQGEAVSRLTSPKYYRAIALTEEQIGLAEISGLAGRALQLCDGSQTVAEFRRETASLFECPAELKSYAAGRLLAHLRKNGLLEIYRRMDEAGREGHTDVDWAAAKPKRPT